MSPPLPHLERGDLRDTERLLRLRPALARAGCLSAGPAGDRELIACAEEALARARDRGNPGALLRVLLALPAAERGIGQDAEQRARRRLLEREDPEPAARAPAGAAVNLRDFLRAKAWA